MGTPWHPGQGASPTQARVERRPTEPTFLSFLARSSTQALGDTGLQTLHQYKLQEAQKNKIPGEDPHSAKGSQRHLKRKPGFPQCHLRRMGGGAQSQLPTWVAEKDLQVNPGYERA